MPRKPSLRRSKRTRVANQKYLNDDWDENALRIIQNSSSESDSNIDENDEVANDEEFIDGNDIGISEVGHDEENNESTDDSSDDSVDVEDEQLSSSEVMTGNNVPTRTVSAKTKSNVPPALQESQHSRGVPNIDRKSGKIAVFHDTFGTGIDDVNHVLAGINRWHLRARDTTLPSRATISEALAHDWSSQALPDTHGGTLDPALEPRQKLSSTRMENLQHKRFIPDGHAHQVVLGPEKRQNLYTIKYLESLDFGQAWRQQTVRDIGLQQREAESSIPARSNSDTEDMSKTTPKRFHEGWLINVGAKVSTMAWYTGKVDSHHAQYLAIAPQSTKAQRGRNTGIDQSRSQAFSPSLGYPSHIQIWQIPCRATVPTNIQALSFDSKVQLSHLIATEVGNIMQVLWLPKIDSIPDHQEHLGGLAILSTDGCFRVVDVPQSRSDTPLPVCFQLHVPSVCIRPREGVVFSTFTFANHQDVILGTSTGEVYIYNLQQCRASDTSVPYFTAQLHHTYVMQVVTAGQNELSHTLASSSAAGDLRLTDLRSPHQDYVQVPRSRLPTRNLIYCASTQSFITTIDHSGRTEVQSARTTISAHQLRHFYSQILLSKLPNNTGTASALAGSRLHPYITVGNTQGTVQCQNVFKKILPKAGGWVQKICEYEWMPMIDTTEEAGSEALSKSHNPTESQDLDSQSTLLYHGHDTRPGISRFQEGFALEKQDLSGANPNKSAKQTGRRKSAKRKAPSNYEDGYDSGVFEDEVDGVVNDNQEADAEADANDNNATRSSSSAAKAKAKAHKTRIAQLSTPNDTSTNETVAEVIFEQENAVTAMCWNEKPECAGWIAMGWGSGIVRIQDLSHDAE